MQHNVSNDSQQNNGRPVSGDMHQQMMAPADIGVEPQQQAVPLLQERRLAPDFSGTPLSLPSPAMPAREYKLPDLNSIVQGDSDMEVESVSNNSPEVRHMGVSMADQSNINN